MILYKDEDMFFVVIILGVYIESYGYVLNFMFDEKCGWNIFMDDVNFFKEKYEFYWWDDVELLWVIVEK